MTTFVSDFTKSPEQIVIDLINYDNRATLTSAQIYLGTPVPTSGTMPERNTEMVVTARPNTGIEGSVTVQYDRVDLAAFVRGRSLEFQVGTATRLSDLIPQINQRFGFNLTLNDYVDVILPAFRGTLNEIYNIALVTKVDSLVYRGSLVLKVRSNDISLTTTATVLTLDGLTYEPRSDSLALAIPTADLTGFAPRRDPSLASSIGVPNLTGFSRAG